MDKLTPDQRKAIMRRVRSTDTAPEMRVRRLIYGMGYRYRLHDAKLPGKPDLVFLARKKAIFVHGCFWHGHDCRAGRNRPSSNVTYWTAKLDRNRQRDAGNQQRLAALGWRWLIVWECTIKDEKLLAQSIISFLEG